MLTKEQYDVAKVAIAKCLSSVECAARDALKPFIAEYESANPPKPVAVNCSVCGSATEHRPASLDWRCTNKDCGTFGPVNDTDAAKWNRLHGRRKLPLEVWQAYFVFQGKARKMGMPPSGIVFGDPIDISEFLE